MMFKVVLRLDLLVLACRWTLDSHFSWTQTRRYLFSRYRCTIFIRGGLPFFLQLFRHDNSWVVAQCFLILLVWPCWLILKGTTPCWTDLLCSGFLNISDVAILVLSLIDVLWMVGYRSCHWVGARRLLQLLFWTHLIKSFIIFVWQVGNFAPVAWPSCPGRDRAQFEYWSEQWLSLRDPWTLSSLPHGLINLDIHELGCVNAFTSLNYFRLFRLHLGLRFYFRVISN